MPFPTNSGRPSAVKRPVPAPAVEPNQAQMLADFARSSTEAVVDVQTKAALRLASTLSGGQAPISQRGPIVWALLRDLSAQVLHPLTAKKVLLHLVDSVKCGYVPVDAVNSIGNILLGELPAWNESDRCSALKSFLVAITDAGHSELLRGAVIVSALRFLEAYPPISPKARGELTVWLGFAFLREQIPRELADEVLRSCFVTLRTPAVAERQRGKVAWVLSTLVDSNNYPNLPIEELAQIVESPEADIPESIKEQIHVNLNRRTLLSSGFLQHGH